MDVTLILCFSFFFIFCITLFGYFTPSKKEKKGEFWNVFVWLLRLILLFYATAVMAISSCSSLDHQQDHQLSLDHGMINVYEPAPSVNPRITLWATGMCVYTCSIFKIVITVLAVNRKGIVLIGINSKSFL